MVEAGVTRRTVVAVSACLMALLAVGCRDEPARQPAQPTRMMSDPLPEAGPAMRPAEDEQPYPTWTLPVGKLDTAPVGTLTPLVAAERGRDGATTVAVGAIPVPTARPTVDLAGAAPALTDPEIVDLMRDVEATRLRADARALVELGTRHALSDPSQDRRGVGAARRWLHQRLGGLGNPPSTQVLTEFEDFDARVAGTVSEQRNVIGTLPGIGLEKRIIYVTSHYDSRVEDAEDAASDAPGANANASGTAAMLETARVLAERRWDATIRFVGFAVGAHDQLGSRHHAPRAANIDLPLVAVVDLHAVGVPVATGSGDRAPVLQLLADDSDDSASRQLARTAQVVGERYLGAEIDVTGPRGLGGEGGDHLSFSDEGFAAVRATAGQRDAAFRGTASDTFDGLDVDTMADAARWAVAVVANLALAPAAPTEPPTLAVDDARPNAIRVSWSAVDDPQVAGYWVAVRTGDESRYDRLEWSGDGASLVLEDLPPSGALYVAVATSDDAGHLSLFGPEAVR